VGPVREAHAWMSKAQNATLGIERPQGRDPVPKSLDWDLWLGPAPTHDYKEGEYHPRRWRSWCDFSNGTLGDFGQKEHTVTLSTKPDFERAKTAWNHFWNGRDNRGTPHLFPLFSALSAGLSQRHVKGHHDRETDHAAQGGEVRVAVALRKR
jgi:hypothetical protein